MRLGNAEDVRRRNLAMLLSKACRTYTNEVLERHKLYDRFADDFINLHRYTDCVCALGKNGHCTNLHIVEGYSYHKKGSGDTLLREQISVIGTTGDIGTGI